jgi:hypothetical protein
VNVKRSEAPAVRQGNKIPVGGRRVPLPKGGRNRESVQKEKS